MVQKLEARLPAFSRLNHTRCFLHVVNLVVQTFIRQFDAPKSTRRGNGDDDEGDAANEHDADIFEDPDAEEQAAEEAYLRKMVNSLPDDASDGWEQELDALTWAEREAAEESLLPVRRILAKIRKVSFKTINSTTLLLPAWKECLEELNLAVKVIPRDVRTRWNSTYDMLLFVFKYQKAYERFTAVEGNGLREKFELGSGDWVVVKQMCDILKVSDIPWSAYLISSLTPYSILLSVSFSRRHHL
ncbi:hypothetical protein BJ165DRAFT_1338755 [Panaeolus papilionaceus]|nr:hypothetical protein BJ165DRAFT_1338755 [Panaeolus papilionaceus]